MIELTTAGDTTQTHLWSLHLQRRVMRLLLLHDQRLFRGQFRTFFVESTLPKMPLLQQYDRYIKLITLSDELLDDILPRIRRQLSLQTSKVHLQEEAPTHGDIDWQRTMRRNLNESPGLPPLKFDTRLRERSMALPENILAVAVLLHFRAELQKTILEGFADEALTQQERQMLVGADERAERELAAPYARALLSQAQQADIETLIEKVQARLRPGASPYRDLIAWWQAFTSLHIGRSLDERSFSLASRREDEKTDAWLYELWITLECVHLLHEMQAIQVSDVHVAVDTLQFLFTWNNRRFRFMYNRQSASPTSVAMRWQHAPAARPDYTIERETPLEVRYKDVLAWREPGVILDAKYYLQGDDPSNTHGPLKKLLGDMQLLGTQHACLFFPRIADPPAGKELTREVKRQQLPEKGEMPGDIAIRLYRLQPSMPVEALQARLRDILNYATENLPDRPKPVCEGVWLDYDSINVSRNRVPPNTILCPQRHIGPNVFQLVDAHKHCLKDPYLCHVIGQPVMSPFVVRASTLEDLKHHNDDIRAQNAETLHRAEQSGDEGSAEQLRSYIFQGVGRTIEQYVKLHANTAALEAQFEEWVFGELWKTHPRCLAEETRKILLSGAFVWEECKQASIDDWAAPAIQYCRALETEVARRLEAPCPKAYKLQSPTSHLTLGTIKYIFEKRDTNDLDVQHNWNIFTSLVAQSNSDVIEFIAFMQRLAGEKVVKHRNLLAHGGPISQEIASSLRKSIIGDRTTPGILIWLVEKMHPV